MWLNVNSAFRKLAWLTKTWYIRLINSIFKISGELKSSLMLSAAHKKIIVAMFSKNRRGVGGLSLHVLLATHMCVCILYFSLN